MRFAKKMDGLKLFKRNEYLTTQQVQSFFSRMVAKCHYDQGELSAPDIMAAEEQRQMDVTRQAILQEVQLWDPIVCDNLDFCALYREKRLKQLSTAILCIVCNYFDV